MTGSSAEVTLYELLGVSKNATTEQIRAAYRRLMRTAHPDSGGSPGMFRSVQEAYETLSDPERRKAYDQRQGSGETRRGTSESTQRAGADRQGHEERTGTTDRGAPPHAGRARPMDPPPPPPPWDGQDVTFSPPISHPESERPKAPRWTKVWMAIWLAIGFLVELVEAIGLWATIESTGSTDGIIPFMIGLAVFFLIVGLLPWWLSKRSTKAPAAPVASDFIRPEDLMVRSFGEPGRGLSAGRFGARAEAGAEGERRTVKLLSDSILKGIPSARLVNGIRWPGTDHADIDHAVLAGNRLVLVDSKMWQDGHYWWDNNELYRDGEEQKPLHMGYAVDGMRKMFPNLLVEGFVLVHSPTGKLDRPQIDQAAPPVSVLHDPNRTLVSVVNAHDLVGAASGFLAHGDRAHVVDLVALRALLGMMV